MVLKKLFSRNIWTYFPARGSCESVVPWQTKLALLIFSISLIPFILIAFYNAPFMDDFTFSAWAKQMDFMRYMRTTLTNENGRYTVIALLYLIPDPYNGVLLYKLFPILVLFFFVFSLSSFVRVFFRCTVAERWMIALGVAACYINSMPTLYQGIYWMTGCLAHFLPLIILLWIFISLKKVTIDPISLSKKRILTIVLIVSVFLIVGFEEIILVFVISALFFLCVLSFLLKLKHSSLFSILFFTSVLGGMLLLLSPGTLARARATESEYLFDLSLTMRGSIYWGSHFILHSVILNPIAVFLLFLFFKPVNSIQPKFNKLPGLNPLFLLIVSYAAILLLFFPGMISRLGTYDRMRNVILFLSVLILAYNILNVKLYYSRLGKLKLPKVVRYLPIVISLCVLFTGNQMMVIMDLMTDSPQKKSLMFTDWKGNYSFRFYQGYNGVYLEAADVQIKYYGKLPPEEVRAVLSEMDYFILPSVAEGMPVTIVEAMKSGVIPLVNDIPGGVRELVVDGETGFRIKDNSVEVYAEKIQGIHVDELLRSKMRSNCISKANELFAPEQNTIAFEQIFLMAAQQSKKKSKKRVYGSRLDMEWLPNGVVSTIRSLV